MLKTIKTKKQMRLDELIKYVIENSLNSFQFTSDNNVDVYFSSNGHFTIAGDSNGNGRSIELADTFTVEVEENITLQTRLDKSVVVYRSNADGELKAGVRNKISLGEILNGYSNSKVLSVYVLIGVEMKLIWEDDNEKTNTRTNLSILQRNSI